MSCPRPRSLCMLGHQAWALWLPLKHSASMPVTVPVVHIVTAVTMGMCPHRLTCWILGPLLMELFWKVLEAWTYRTCWRKWVIGDISLGTVFCHDHSLSVSLLPVLHEVNSFCLMILLLHGGCRKHVPRYIRLSLLKPGAKINPSSLRLLLLLKMTFTQFWEACIPVLELASLPSTGMMLCLIPVVSFRECTLEEPLIFELFPSIPCIPTRSRAENRHEEARKSTQVHKQI